MSFTKPEMAGTVLRYMHHRLHRLGGTLRTRLRGDDAPAPGPVHTPCLEHRRVA